MENQEILYTLKREFHAAQGKMEAATETFDKLILEAPDGSGSDDLERLFEASKKLSSARQELVEAEVRLRTFIAVGMIPNHLKKGIQREESSGGIRNKSAAQG